MRDWRFNSVVYVHCIVDLSETTKTFLGVYPNKEMNHNMKRKIFYLGGNRTSHVGGDRGISTCVTSYSHRLRPERKAFFQNSGHTREF